MVFAAIAQSMAFSYLDYADEHSYETPIKSSFQSKRYHKQSMCQALCAVLFSTRDVIDDAHSTFISGVADEEDNQMQLDELKRAKNAAFNWSDEEMLEGMDDLSKVVYKDKYQKPKRKNAYVAAS